MRVWRSWTRFGRRLRGNEATDSGNNYKAPPIPGHPEPRRRRGISRVHENDFENGWIPNAEPALLVALFLTRELFCGREVPRLTCDLGMTHFTITLICGYSRSRK